MMLLSRFWYAVLAILAALAAAVVILAVGQYNRRAQTAMTEELAGDTQVVKWAIQIDARHRLDALLIGALEKGVQDGVVAANGQDKVPAKAKDEAKKALLGVMEKLPPDFKPDAVFVVDRDGRLVAQIGYDRAQTFEDFELGGYAAVNDALHGYLRDDTWVWGGQLYRVVARPVEYDVTQPPAGAIVAIKAVDRKFAQDLAKLTRTNVLFYAAGQKSASAAGDPAEETLLDPMVLELARLGDDKLYGEKGRTDVHMVGDTSGAMFQRLEGEGDAGFGVIRSKSVIAGPMGFLTGADDKDKVALTTTSSLATLIAIVILGIGIGILLSFLEHSVPIKEMVSQAARLKKGDIDLLQLPRFRGQLRDIATDLNTGIERVADKGGGAPRKAADLESILGPMPAQPAMSAFAFPMPGAQDSAPFPQVPPARASQPNAPPPAPHASAPHMPPMQKPATPPPGIPAAMQAPVIQQPMTQKMDMPPGALQRPETSPTVVKPLGMVDPPHARPPAQSSPQRAPVRMPDGEEEEATMVAAVPQDVLAAAAKPSEELAEWHQVYDEFLKVKKQCNEPTEGLSFEKFQLTLKKNRDALVERHKCKRVKFTVYVKDGRASLKATPVKD